VKRSIVGVSAVAIYLVVLAASDSRQFVQFALNGAVIGAIYGVMAIGFTLVYRTVGYLDLAFGVLPAIGAYLVLGQDPQASLEPSRFWSVGLAFATGLTVAWLFRTLAGRAVRDRFGPRSLDIASAVAAVASGTYAAGVTLGLGLPLPGSANLVAAAIVACVLTGLLAVGLHRGLYVRLRSTGRGPAAMIVGTLGALLVLEAGVALSFGALPRPFRSPIDDGVISVLGGILTASQLLILATTIGVYAAVRIMLTKTTIGRTLRAVGDNEEMAGVIGIDTVYVSAFAFFVGGALAAVAGMAYAAEINTVDPRIGFALLLKGWIAAVIGGVGSVTGALIGAFLLAMLESYGVWFIGAQWQNAVALVALVGILLLKPTGLLRARQ
jgi:branched-chain amino acid transport system permease protein